MYILRKSFKFEASHQLKHYDGKCSRLHGHSWELIVEIIGKLEPSVNPQILIDYFDISKVVKPLLEEKFDHWHLNETLNTEDPTSEFVAKWLFDYLKPSFSSKHYKLNAIEISETCTVSCRYTE